MRLLLCGYGSIGRRHFANARSILPTETTWTVVEPQREAWIPSEGVQFVADASALEGRFDVAFICSPTAAHAEQIVTLADRADAFFIEKPLAHDRDSLTAIRAALGPRKVSVMVGCNYRFETGLLHLERLLREGAIGRPISLRAEFGQWLPSWRPTQDYRQGYAARRVTGGGVVLDRIHELDYVSWLLGPVVEVKALHGKLSLLEIETEDTAEILLRFASGAIGSVHVDYLQREYVCELKIIGERGSLAWRYRPTCVRLLRENEGWTTVFEEQIPDVNAMYVAELQHFFDALHRAVPPVNGLDEAAATLETALAALAVD
jgi:predicted dehydrogenase